MPLNSRQAEYKGWIKRQFFDKSGVLTFEDLETKAIGLAKILFQDLSAIEISEVITELTQENSVVIPLGDSLYDAATFMPWIGDRRKTTSTKRWDAYANLLVKRDWEAPVIKTLGDQTDEIVELLGDPLQPGPWVRRGLLMGEVQSGKTATYLGVLNKALDYGYRLIVVIGGHTEDLRRQTQVRFDTDLLGIDSETWDSAISNAAIRLVGVGDTLGLSSNLMTTVAHDFAKTKVKSGITVLSCETPTIFIIKKNTKLIKNVTDYIKGQAGSAGRLDLPLIVIDDESDWGTPNTGDDTDPTRVNLAIRKLLVVSNRSSYLGITATPFANIFIDPESVFNDTGRTINDVRNDSLFDLFPSDYIRVMFPPSTYLGIGTYFPEGGHAAINIDVHDCLQIIPIKHKKDFHVSAMPDSMKIAIIEFLCGTAIRRIRDKKIKASSMLINVSRFKDVQHQIANFTNEFLNGLVSTILGEFSRSVPLISSNAISIQNVWHETYANIQDITWPEIASKLIEIAQEFRVVLINGDTARTRAKHRSFMTRDARMMDDLIPTIFIGGDILSRGLTLDGLQVSYFVREPRTMDTLMQTGRWFGYRPGFSDLVRIWIPEGTRDDFIHSAEVTNELRESILLMKARELTPRDFGLRVRMHPDSVDIVAAKKARHTEIVDIGPIAFQNRLEAAWMLSDNTGIWKANEDAVLNLITSLGGKDTVAKTNASWDVWHSVALDTILDFFRRFRGHPDDLWWGSVGSGTLPIADHFDMTPGKENWDVVLIGSGSDIPFNVGNGFTIKRSIRNGMEWKAIDHLIKIPHRRVSTPGDLPKSLTTSELKTLKDKMPNQKITQASVLANIDHPILMIYALTSLESNIEDTSEFTPVPPGITLITAAVAFPSMTPEQIKAVEKKGKRYRVNMVWWRNATGFIDDIGDDEAEEDDN